jgi:nucleoside-diphosphate kinase
MTMEKREQTLVLIKPDALKNSLTGYVLSQLSEFHTGLRFAAAKIVAVSRMLAEVHYVEHAGKPFFESLVEYIRGQIHFPDAPQSRRVVAFVYYGPGAIQKIRSIAGPTNPHVARDKNPGCIRALGTIAPILDVAGNVIDERMDNLIHASANADDAEREIKLWFRPTEIPPLMRSYATEMMDKAIYFKGNRLYEDHEPNSICLVTEGEFVWKSDAEALRSLLQGKGNVSGLRTVAAKYLINEDRDTD